MSHEPSRAAEGAARPPRETLERIVAANWWYHRMELDEGLVTPGAHGDNLIPVAHLLRNVALAGARCLDIGTMDGKMAFFMEREGAAEVLAVDGVAKDTVPALSEVFGSSVRYRSGFVLERLPELLASEGLFDFVLCSGVAYHVYSPFDLVAHVRWLLRNRGLAIFETAAIRDDTHCHLSLNRGDHYREFTTLWIPTTACFRYMLEFMAFRVIAEAELKVRDYHVVRTAWLVQADRPATLAAECPDAWLATLLAGQAPGWSHDYLKPQFDHATFQSRPETTITSPAPAGLRQFALEDPVGYADEARMLAAATPAWRLASAGPGRA